MVRKLLMPKYYAYFKSELSLWNVKQLWNVTTSHTCVSLSSFSSLMRSADSDSNISDAWVAVVFSSARSAVNSTTWQYTHTCTLWILGSILFYKFYFWKHTVIQINIRIKEFRREERDRWSRFSWIYILNSGYLYIDTFCDCTFLII